MWPFRPNVETLLRKGDVAGLIKASRHGRAERRLQALAALAALASEEALDALIWRVGDPNEAVRDAATARLGQAEPSTVVERLLAVVAAAVEDDGTLARTWHTDAALTSRSILSLLGQLGGTAAAAFLAEVAAGRHPCLDPELGAAALAEMAGPEGARTIVEALEADLEHIGLEKDTGDEQRLALLGRVAGLEAAARHRQRDADGGQAFARDVVPRAVAVLERLVLRPHVATAAIDALGRIGTAEAVEALGRAAVGEALSAFANEAYLRRRAVAVLAETLVGAAEAIAQEARRYLAQALRMPGSALRNVRRAALEALADWTPDNADDHAWLLVAKGLHHEAAELGAPAIAPLTEAVRDPEAENREAAVGALVGLEHEQVYETFRALSEDAGLDGETRAVFRAALDRAQARQHLPALRSAHLAGRRLAADWLAKHGLTPPRGTEDEAFFLAASGQWDALVERGPVATAALRLAAADEPLPAATALARLKSDLACEFLGPLIRQGGPDSVKAVDALVELGTERAALTLASALGKVPDAEPIISALIAIGAPAATALTPALEANDLVLNRLAARVLRSIPGAPADAQHAAVLAAAAGDWPAAIQAGEAAVGPLSHLLERAAHRHASYDLLTEVATALARVAPPADLLATVDDEGRPVQVRLALAAGLARAGHSQGIDRLMRWLFAVPRQVNEPPLPWLAALLDDLAERMGLTGKAGRDMATAGTYAIESVTAGDDVVGLRADTTAGDEALERLTAADGPAAVNVLNLAAEMADAEVVVPRPGYQEPLRLSVNFERRRQVAARALRRMGKPAYDPDGYLGLAGE